MAEYHRSLLYAVLGLPAPQPVDPTRAKPAHNRERDAEIVRWRDIGGQLHIIADAYGLTESGVSRIVTRERKRREANT